ncbi:hypothetical protein [Haloechinothrix alba]|nr:hypothetical protein [Haloechinothrix alba]
MRTMTQQQAADRVEDHLQSAIAALPDDPTLTVVREHTAECTDPTDDGPRGRYQVSKAYALDDLPVERNDEYAEALHSYWTSDNYRVFTDRRPDRVSISVEHEEDAFRMSLRARSGDGRMRLGASSPCVWPDGVPPGEHEDEQPDDPRGGPGA